METLRRQLQPVEAVLFRVALEHADQLLEIVRRDREWNEGAAKARLLTMFEAVGRERLPEYFSHLFSLLRPGGLFLNHGIGGRPAPAAGHWTTLTRRLEPLLVGGSTFRARYIFPTGGIVPVSEANLVAEQAGFEVRDVENLREHYAITLRHWARRLEANKEEARRVGRHGERVRTGPRVAHGQQHLSRGEVEATTGQRRILEIEPTELHQRVPLIIGSVEDVENFQRFVATEPG